MFGNVSHGNTVTDGIAYLIGHSAADPIPEIPQLIAFGKQRESGTQAELSFFCCFVVQKLCKINVRSDWNHPMLPYHIFAPEPSLSDVFFHIAPKC